VRRREHPPDLRVRRTPPRAQHPRVARPPPGTGGQPVLTTAAPARPIVGDLWLRGQASQLARARRFAEEAASAFGFDDDDTYAFAFAANEAVSNAIEHGKPCEGGTVRLRIEEDAGALSFWVKDCGTFVPPAGPADPLAERGRGLAFMTAMVDELELTPIAGGTVIRLTKMRRV
jgi:anti-sigma regulatory factor (Ser/Thr protein kinase)